MRVYAPGLNDTEFGFYFINYHSRLPNLSGVTGTQTGFARSASALTAIGTLLETGDVGASILKGTNAGVSLGLTEADAGTVSAGAVNAATAPPPEPYLSPTALPGAYIVNEYAQTAQYKVEYQEDIKIFFY